MHSDINLLRFKLEAAEKLTEVVHDIYASCLKDKSIGREFQKLQYTIKLANFKAKELEQKVLDDDEENQIAKSNKEEIVEIATTQLGKTAWDDVFEEGNLELPSTGFMDKIKQAVTKNDY